MYGALRRDFRAAHHGLHGMSEYCYTCGQIVQYTAIWQATISNITPAMEQLTPVSSSPCHGSNGGCRRKEANHRLFYWLRAREVLDCGGSLRGLHITCRQPHTISKTEPRLHLQYMTQVGHNYYLPTYILLGTLRECIRLPSYRGYV